MFGFLNEERDEIDNKFISWKENFYTLEDKEYQCHHKDEHLNYYFFHGNIFKRCKKECLTFQELGDISENYTSGETTESKDTKCTKCLINDYLPQVDKRSNCIKKIQWILNIITLFLHINLGKNDLMVVNFVLN